MSEGWYLICVDFGCVWSWSNTHCSVNFEFRLYFALPLVAITLLACSCFCYYTVFFSSGDNVRAGIPIWIVCCAYAKWFVNPLPAPSFVVGFSHLTLCIAVFLVELSSVSLLLLPIEDIFRNFQFHLFWVMNWNWIRVFSVNFIFECMYFLILIGKHCIVLILDHISLFGSPCIGRFLL